VTTVLRTNRAPNPRADQTNNLGGWTTLRGFGTGGAGVYTWLTGAGAPNSINTARRKTWTTGSTNDANSGFELRASTSVLFTVLEGERITVSLYVRSSSVKRAQLKCWGYASTTPTTLIGSFQSNEQILEVNTWTRLAVTADIPPGVAGLQVFADVVEDETAQLVHWLVGDTFDATGLLIEVAGRTLDFFDGTTPDAPPIVYDWLGTPNASQSIQTTSDVPGESTDTVPVLDPWPESSGLFGCDTSNPEFDGVVTVWGMGLPPGTGTVSRLMADGETLEPIRGGQTVNFPAGTFAISDTEAPFDTELFYTLNIKPAHRATFHNYFRNPSFEASTSVATTWLTNTHRDMEIRQRTIPDPVFYGSNVGVVTGHTGGISTPPTTDDRLLMYTLPDPTKLTWKPSTEYRLTGQVNIAPKLFSWAQARSEPPTTDRTLKVPPARAWQDPFFASGGHSWQEILGYDAGDVSLMGTLYVGLCDANGALIPGASLQKVTMVTSTGLRQFTQFDTTITTPTSVPASVYVGFYQSNGTVQEETPTTATIVGSSTAGESPGLPATMIVDTVGATGIIAGDWMYVAYAATAAGVPTPFSDATKWEVVLPLTQNGTGYWGIWRHKWLTTDVQDIIITPTATQTFSALGFWVRGTDKPPTVGTPATFVANEALVAPSITPLNAGRRITLAFGQVTSSKGVADVKNATTLTNAPPVNSNSSVKLVLTDDAMAGAAATPDVTVTWPQTGALAGRKYDLTFNRTYAYDANYVAGSAVQIGFMDGFPPVPNLEEFQRGWLFDALMLDEIDPAWPYPGPLYFDGSTRFPDDQTGIGYTPMYPDDTTYGWDSNDQTNIWTGTPHGSASLFLGASVLGAYSSGCTLKSTEFVEGIDLCEPVFLSDPILPDLSQWLGLLNIGALSWAPRRALLDVLGRHAPVALSQRRSTPSTEFKFITFTLAERTKFIELINSGRILLLRNPDPAYPENMWYISIGDVTEERIYPDHRYPVRRWTVSAIVVDRPSALIAATPGKSWQTVRDTYAMWQTVRDANPAWLNVLIGPATTRSSGINIDPNPSTGMLTAPSVAVPMWEPVP